MRASRRIESRSNRETRARAFCCVIRSGRHGCHLQPPQALAAEPVAGGAAHAAPAAPGLQLQRHHRLVRVQAARPLQQGRLVGAAGASCRRLCAPLSTLTCLSAAHPHPAGAGEGAGRRPGLVHVLRGQREGVCGGQDARLAPAAAAAARRVSRTASPHSGALLPLPVESEEREGSERVDGGAGGEHEPGAAALRRDGERAREG